MNDDDRGLTEREKELKRWNQPYVFQAFPKYLHRVTVGSVAPAVPIWMRDVETFIENRMIFQRGTVGMSAQEALAKADGWFDQVQAAIEAGNKTHQEQQDREREVAERHEDERLERVFAKALERHQEQHRTSVASLNTSSAQTVKVEAAELIQDTHLNVTTGVGSAVPIDASVPERAIVPEESTALSQEVGGAHIGPANATPSPDSQEVVGAHIGPSDPTQRELEDLLHRVLDEREERRRNERGEQESEAVEKQALRKAARELVVMPRLDELSWTPTRWALEAGVGPAVAIDYLSGKTIKLSLTSRDRLTNALGKPAIVLPQ